MTSKFNELVAKLREIFEIDRPELDFGIYRILHSRAKKIDDFLLNRLSIKVKDALSSGSAAQKKQLQDQLDAAIEQAKGLGADPNTLPKVQDLKAKLAAFASEDDAEMQVYAHLLTFFSRYYEDGDFISKRRYKEGVYAIPYSGEEVKLHWANADQYYIKSGESFTNYDFTIDGGKKVHFKLIAAETAKDNIKDNDAVRCFVLWDPKSAEIDEEDEEAPELPSEILEAKDGELYIYFQYKKFKKGTKQKTLLEDALKAVSEKLMTSGLYNEFALLSKAPTEKDKNRTVLEKHLTTYTAKNTSDYFIHKDLKGFLTRELDFYIKNEMMHLDDIQNAEAFKHIEMNLRQIQAVRVIALELIDFMAQLENFQKKLWLKKKFVTQCDYCITMDRVPDELKKEVEGNVAQQEEWKKLGFETKPANDLFAQDVIDARMVDTKFFSEEFKAKLLAAISDIDEQCDGLLIHADNFQGLNLLQCRYGGGVSCIYIDPPFNLKQNGDFLYRTDFKDSTWLCLLEGRVAIGKKLLANDGMMFLRCDYNGNHLVRSLGDSLFGEDNLQAELLVQRIRKNVTGQGKITLPLANDSLFLYFNSQQSSYVNPYLHLKQTREAYWRRMDDSAGYRNPPERNIFGKTFSPYKHDAHFKFSQKTIEEMIAQGRIRLLCKRCGYAHLSGTWMVCPHCGGEEVTPQYRVEATDRQILDTNWMDIAGYSSTTGFSTENSEALLSRVIAVATRERAVVMDFFGGSGTTLAVASKLNRRWIGIEMGAQIYEYIIPRLKKINKSRCFKYMTLESYEDALNNIELVEPNGELFGAMQDDYLLKYMLDIEAKGSVISTDDFKHPFDYKLKIAVDSSGASAPRNVDLPETFKYLIGLKVLGETRRIADGFLYMDGTLPNGDKAFVLWRDVEKVPNAELNKLLDKLGIKPGDSQYDVVYVNGDHAVANATINAQGQEKKLKVQQIENEFLSRMFSED